MKNTAKLSLAALVLAALASSSAVAQSAKVTSVTGKVECQKTTSSPWTEVKQDDVLDVGSIISTGFNSYATLNIDGNVCTLQPLTRMSIEHLSKSDVVQNGTNKTVTKTAVFIDTGKASFKVNSTDKKLNDFKVHSPAATASVRGTEYTFNAIDGSISTTKGMVALSSGTSRTVVNRNTELYIRPEKEPSVFTSIKDVGGGSGAVPVYAGETVKYVSSSGERQTPLAQRKINATALPESTATLAEKEKCTPVASAFESIAVGAKKDAVEAATTSISISLPDNW